MGSGPKAPGETGEERAYAEIGAEQYQMARQLKPVREDLFKRVSNFKTQRRQLRDLSSADAALAGAGAVTKASASPAGQPGTLAQVGISRAGNQAGQAVSTERRANAAHVTGLQGLAGMAVGEQGAAIEGMGDLASRGLQEAVTRARSNAISSAATTDAVASGIGAVAGGIYGGRKPDDGMPAALNSSAYTKPIG